MIKEDKFWRLAHKYRRYFINGFSDSIDLSNYNDEFWSLFVDNFFNVCTGNNYLCIKLIYYCKEVLPKDVLNGLFFLCLIKQDYYLLLTNPDKLVQSFPGIYMWTPGDLKDCELLIPDEYFQKIMNKINLHQLTSNLNNCDETELKVLFPKSYKNWELTKQLRGW